MLQLGRLGREITGDGNGDLEIDSS